MEREEVSNTISVRIAANNFKINEDHKSLPTRFGRNMSGKDKQLKISETNTTKVRIGSEKP